MSTKQTEALKLALDCVSTLANARDWVGCNQNERWDEDEMYAELCNATICLKKSLSIIQEALAEQPAQHSASVLEQNTSNSLETTNQEAQDEPVAWMTHSNNLLLFHRTRAEALNWQTQPTPLYTSPPASKPWVGLTQEDMYEIGEFKNTHGYVPTGFKRLAAAIEAKLKDKNGY